MLTACYLRISSDPQDQRAGVTRQREDCLAEAERRGWQVTHVLEDNDQSAYGGRERPAYGQLLTLVERGEVQAVLAWAGDRLHRDVQEYLSFEALARKKGLQVAFVKGGDWALDTVDGRLPGRLLAVIAQGESEKKAERVNRALQQRAAKGLPANTRFRPLGFEDDGITHKRAEVKKLRACAEDLLTGRRSLVSWAKELGKTPTGLRLILMNRRMVGEREFQGQVYRAVWEPILERDVWETLCVLFEGRSTPARPRRNLLAGICTCEVCGEKLVVGQESRSGVRVYRCRRSHVVRRASRLEDYTRDVVLEWAYMAGERPVVEMEAQDELQAQIRALEGRLEQLVERMADPSFPLDTAMRAQALIQGRLEGLRTQLGAVQRPPGSLPYGEGRAEWDAWWEAAELGARRGLLARFVGEVRVHPTRKGRQGGAWDDVEVLPPRVPM